LPVSIAHITCGLRGVVGEARAEGVVLVDGKSEVLYHRLNDLRSKIQIYDFIFFFFFLLKRIFKVKDLGLRV
jgi:hypothetical protein